MPRTGTLSATNIAAYHHLNCDLFLHNIYHGSGSTTGGSHDQASRGVIPPSELSEAQFERGLDWESTLFGWLGNDVDLLLQVPSTPLQAEYLKENIEFDDRDHFFIAGLTFWPPREAFAFEFAKEGTVPVTFSLAKPDLLEITRSRDGNGVTWKVVDAKASKTVKTSHHVQIYFYTLCLNYLLPPPYFRPSGTAAIWLPPADGFNSSPPSFEDLKTINISLLSDSLKSVFFRQLPRILALSREKVQWHYNPLCRNCLYNSECRSRTLQEGTLGSMPNISLEQAKVLKSLLSISHDSNSQSLGAPLVTDIEDLHTLIADQSKLDNLAMSFPSTVKKAKRILGLPTRSTTRRVPSSAVVDAAMSKRIEIIHRRNFTCPRTEDVAIILSILQDPASLEVVAFCASIFSSDGLSQTKHGSGKDIVKVLASIIGSLLDRTPTPRTQFYIFSSGEHTALQTILVDTALTSDAGDMDIRNDIRLCIGALSEGASLLLTSFQPLILSGALLDFLAKGRRSKAELKMCLERLDLSTDGTVDQLRQRIQEEVQRLKAGGRVISDQDRRSELGQLPRIVILKREVERLLALPLPGYWDLPECVTILSDAASVQCPSDEEVFERYKNGTSAEVRTALENRNRSIYDALQRLRFRVSSCSTGKPELLVNEARVLSASFMDICKQDHLRKLFFMQQFEVLAKLTELWRSRIDGCPDATILEYRSTEQGTKGVEHTFHLISGILDMPADKERSFYDFLLAEDLDDIALAAGGNDIDQSNIPVEALFDDLGVSGLMFPLNTYTKSRWSAQHPLVQRKLLVADVRDIDIDAQDNKTTVMLQTWGSWGVKLVRGHHYRLSPRLVDFNITKILSTLLELDLRCGEDESEEVPFLQLISDPRSLAFSGEQSAAFSKNFTKAENSIQSTFRELDKLDVQGAGALVLKASQQRAAKRILANRLSVVWGPPGTGKTYTLALSLLRLLDVQSRLQNTKRQIIFITAMTHAAIRAFLSKLNYLLECYRGIGSYPASWIRDLRIEHVLKGNDHPGPMKADPEAKLLYAGTVYQLYNFSKRHSFEVDCVIIDEAGQLSLSSTALVLRSLSPTGRIVVAGDSEQLAPIISAQYPQLQTRLFGSILDCLMHHSRRPGPSVDGTDRPASPVEASSMEMEMSSQGTIVQLTENFRLNPDLGEFISTIYSRAFKPQKVQARQLATRLQSIKDDIDIRKDFGVHGDIQKDVQRFLLALSDVMLRRPQTLLKPPSISCTSTVIRTPTDQSLNTPGRGRIDLTPHPISLALIRLRTYTSRPERAGYEVHVRGEAALAAALVTSIRRCSPDDDIFVATPHRVQRQAVNAALRLAQIDEEVNLANMMQGMTLGARAVPDLCLDKVTVDTVERLQGSEAAFVICLFSLPPSSASASELKFLLERRRLNVSISRAKTLCIVVASPELLRPSATVLADEETAKGYGFLRAFEERSWSSTLNINLDSF